MLAITSYIEMINISFISCYTCRNEQCMYFENREQLSILCQLFLSRVEKNRRNVIQTQIVGLRVTFDRIQRVCEFVASSKWEHYSFCLVSYESYNQRDVVWEMLSLVITYRGTEDSVIFVISTVQNR